MAKLYTNDKNFLVIKMNGAEASGLGFGIEIPGCLNAIICGGCNSQIEHKEIYYIAGINEVMCKDCAEDYVKNMSHYTDIDSLTSKAKNANELLEETTKEAITLKNKVSIWKVVTYIMTAIAIISVVIALL